jgi:hypothetical protein
LFYILSSGPRTLQRSEKVEQKYETGNGRMRIFNRAELVQMSDFIGN